MTALDQKSVEHDQDSSDSSGFGLGVTISMGNLARVKALIEDGLDLNQAINDTSSPLQLALNLPRSCRFEMVQMMLEGGANPLYTVPVPSTSIDRSHPSPLIKAFSEGLLPELSAMLNTPFIDLLAKGPEGNTLAHDLTPKIISKIGPESVVDALKLVQNHFEEVVLPKNPHLPANHLWCVRNDTGDTPPMQAISSVHTLRWMLDDPRVGLASRLEDSDRDGHTLLFMAARAGQDDAVRFLVGRGARVDVVDKGGRSMIDDVMDQVNISSDAPAYFERLSTVASMLRAALAAKDAAAAIDGAMILAGHVNSSRSAL